MDIVIDKAQLLGRLRMLSFTSYQLIGPPDQLRIRLQGADGLTLVEVSGGLSPSEYQALETALQDKVAPFLKHPK
jgi:hypothetical protein